MEYDYLEASALYASLESKLLGGLYVAGQTNGTSGYEEAAAQGLMAGINARRSLDGLEPVILGRDEAYIGVLIDDLVTLSPKEPYRMFTSRAERRLALRQDSADLRLTPLGISIGLVSEERKEKFEQRRKGIDEIKQLISARKIRTADVNHIEALKPHLGESLELALRDPALGAIMDESPSAWDFLSSLVPETASYPETWAQTALLEARYKGYLEKESRLASRLDRSERLRIPPDLDYQSIPGLSKEAIE